jgi:hypothetical protein
VTHRVKPSPRTSTAEDDLGASSGTITGTLVRLAGLPVRFEIEQHVDPEKIDHVWLLVRAGRDGMFRISLNTWSLRAFRAGSDPRIRVALVLSRWDALPALGIFPADGLDYDRIVAADPIVYREYERTAFEELIGSRFQRAMIVEAWGEVYLRGHRGIHQVHSRRASSAIPTDYRGRDGAVRFYYQEEASSELLLLKFSGQP